MSELYYYCWSCGEQHPSPSIVKSCESCHKIYLEDPLKKFSKCRCCGEIKKYNTDPLCTRCYVIMKEKNKKGHY